MAEFDARGYWERRLTETYAIDGVGYAGLGPAFNTWMYRVRRHVFLRTLRPLLPDPPRARVLDVGTGTGFYVDRWHELGAGSVTGSDLTDTAVAKLSERYPGDDFVRFDVGDPKPPPQLGPFDAISAMDVLFHIVDDERFARSFATVRELLAPGGVFAFTDNFLHRATERAEHQASRPLGEIEAAVHDAGLDIVDRRPMFVLLNAPVDSGNRLLHAAWSAMGTLAVKRDALGGVAGALAYPLELGLLRLVREGPSTELMVCRRR
jgi:SAM-dependent methyltransferase